MGLSFLLKHAQARCKYMSTNDSSLLALPTSARSPWLTSTLLSEQDGQSMTYFLKIAFLNVVRVKMVTNLEKCLTKITSRKKSK